MDIIRYISISYLGGPWAVLFLVLAALNLKLIPFAWHIRLFRPLFLHFALTRSRPCDSSSLFQPVITTTRSPWLECDYMFHKSNSTYFSDLDIARSHLMSCLFAKFLDNLRAPTKQDQANGPFSLNLGSVTCNFKKQIRPYQAYEMWTRVLTWDEKWLYLVTHFVERGKVKPRWYSLQPWKKPDPQPAQKADSDKSHSPIFATSVARYVLKRGRVSIPPEKALAAAGLLPTRLTDHASVKAQPIDSAARRNVTSRSSPVDDHGVVDEPTELALSQAYVWDWERVETSRKEGLKFAKLIDGLDDAHLEFTGSSSPALGHY